MDVIVERFQHRKIVSNPASPMLYYLRQKPRPTARGHRCPCRLHSEKLCHDEGRREARHRSPGGGDSRQPCQRRQGEAERAGHFPHDVPLSRHGGLGQMYGAQYLEGEYPLYPRQGAEAGERQYRRDPQPGECGLCARQKAREQAAIKTSSGDELGDDGDQGRKSAGIKKE